MILGASAPAGRRRYTRAAILASVDRLMRPRSIAVIGASDVPGKIGHAVLRHLVDGGASRARSIQ